MEELIKRIDAIKAFCMDCKGQGEPCEHSDTCKTMKVLRSRKKIPAVEPNLLIAPETIERGSETYIGEDIVVCHQEDYMDMMCKAMQRGEYGEKPKQGEWIITEQDNGHKWWIHRKCSECGGEIIKPPGVSAMKFCPNCGARMKGVDDETTA